MGFLIYKKQINFLHIPDAEKSLESYSDRKLRLRDFTEFLKLSIILKKFWRGLLATSISR